MTGMVNVHKDLFIIKHFFHQICDLALDEKWGARG